MSSSKKSLTRARKQHRIIASTLRPPTAAAANKRSKRNLRLHGTTCGPPTALGPNPYLNYFRQFYATKGGRVTEAAKEAGANWRRMSVDEKGKYRNPNKEKFSRSYYSRIRKLNKIFRMLKPTKQKSSMVKANKLLGVKRILERWTREVYKEVVDDNSSGRLKYGDQLRNTFCEL